MKARITETIPPIRNLMAMILNPSPSCIGETTLVPIQIQITPKATITTPAITWYFGLQNLTLPSSIE
jgi:hypothetical protein